MVFGGTARIRTCLPIGIQQEPTIWTSATNQRTRDVGHNTMPLAALQAAVGEHSDGTTAIQLVGSHKPAVPVSHTLALFSLLDARQYGLIIVARPHLSAGAPAALPAEQQTVLNQVGTWVL
jgi:hypothetical protein